jgi:hypothetical protein
MRVHMVLAAPTCVRMRMDCKIDSVSACSPQQCECPDGSVLCRCDCPCPLQSEPGETSVAVGNAAMASYALSVNGLIRGKAYTTYRISGSLPGVQGFQGVRGCSCCSDITKRPA